MTYQLWKLFAVLACDTWPIPLDTACQRKRLSHRQNYNIAHIMFSWDYLYLDDLCSVITLHVTVQRCSPNINSPKYIHTTRFWKNREIEFLGHRISCSQSVFSFAMFTEFLCLSYWPKWSLFSCELSCNWVLYLVLLLEEGFVNTLIKNLRKRNFYSLTDH